MPLTTATKLATAALAALTLLPTATASAGRWTVQLDGPAADVRCRATSAFGEANPRGFYMRQSAPLFAFSTACTGSRPWNAASREDWGHTLYRNAEPPNEDPRYQTSFYGSYVYFAPGHPVLTTPLPSYPLMAVDRGFASDARIIRIAYRDGGRPAGALYQRLNKALSVGLYANAFSGDARQRVQINGCAAGQAGTQPSQWEAGQRPANCDAEYVFSDVDGGTIDVPAGQRVVDAAWMVECPTVCSGVGNPGHGRISFHGAEVTIEETTPPQARIAPGGLASGARVVGRTQALTFDANDAVGLDRAELYADGRRIGGVDWQCPNRDNQAGTTRAPCADNERSYVGQAIQVDTETLLNGRHAGVLQVFDALGNRRDVPFAFTTFNASVDRSRRVERRVEGFTASGSPTEIVAAGRRAGAKHRRSGVTLRRWSVGPTASSRPIIRGRVRAASGRRRAIGRAKLAVFVRSSNRLFARKRDITTSRSGRFAYRLPRGSSRDVTFVYRGGGGRRGAIGEVAANVRARVTLRASRRAVLNGRTVGFSGRVTGRPLPRRGVLVELQAFQRGSWRTFQQTRTTNRRGSWRSTYRFETVRGRAAFRFRARVRNQTGYPYSTGTSNRVRVVVRG